MSEPHDFSSPVGEKCGVLGLFHPKENVVGLIVPALQSLQHRGQESAGACVSDGRELQRVVGMGLVHEVLGGSALAHLNGPLAIAHTRYSTAASSELEHAQPAIAGQKSSQLALAHNGNIVNMASLRGDAVRSGIEDSSGTDSELITQLITRAAGSDWRTRIRSVLQNIEGAYSLAMLDNTHLHAARDPWGIRPLVLGALNGGWAIASETCALDAIGATFVRDVLPGELISIGHDGITSEIFRRTKRLAACSFEHIYFARPDSRIGGRVVAEMRERLGAELAREQPAFADMVVPIPRSGRSAARGYSTMSGLPYREAITVTKTEATPQGTTPYQEVDKVRAASQRTFMVPDSEERRAKARAKYVVLAPSVRGKRVVLVDDSVVRGTTMATLVVAKVREAGASEVHLRIGAPPLVHACYLGVKTGPDEALIAHNRTIDQVRDILGVDSLGYLSIEGLSRALAQPEESLCNACFHGQYPMPIDLGLDGYDPDKARSGLASLRSLAA